MTTDNKNNRDSIADDNIRGRQAQRTELATLIGRLLARQWLREQGLPSTAENPLAKNVNAGE